MAKARVEAALQEVTREARQRLRNALATQPVGKLFDGRFLKLIVKLFGDLLKGFTVAEITAFLVGLGIPQPWAGIMAKAIYAILHP